MIADVGLLTILVLGLVLVVGAVTQSVAGFGLAVVGAPFIVLLAPPLIPGALLVTSVLMPVVELVRRPGEVQRPVLGWALAGRLLTMPLGVWLVAASPTTVIEIVVGGMVLVAVLGSLTRLQVRAEPRTALVAGLLTGISGTAASIGGPFLGLVLQHERPAAVRSTLAGFFVVGSLTSLLGLAVAGQLHVEQVLVGLLWVPFVLVGLVLSVPLRRRIDAGRMRQAVLCMAAVAGVLVLARGLLG